MSKCLERNIGATLQRGPDGRARPMAYLFSLGQWETFEMEVPIYEPAFNFEARTIYGDPYYVGLVNPDPYPLFLPEKTVRSMVGLWDGPTREARKGAKSGRNL